MSDRYGDALHGSIEWFAEHKVHPAQDTWTSMRVDSEHEARVWLQRMAASGAIEIRLVRKNVFVVEGRKVPENWPVDAAERIGRA